MIVRQTRQYEPGTVLSSWESEITGHYGLSPTGPGVKLRVQAKPPPACEHAVPTIRAKLLIRTTVEQIWHCGPLAGQVNYDKSHGLV